MTTNWMFTFGRYLRCPILSCFLLFVAARSDPPGIDNRWRNDGRCGDSNVAQDGGPSICPTRDQYLAGITSTIHAEAESWLEHAPCCSSSGWCGSLPEHCYCPGCVDYRGGYALDSVRSSLQQQSSSHDVPPQGLGTVESMGQDKFESANRPHSIVKPNPPAFAKYYMAESRQWKTGGFDKDGSSVARSYVRPMSHPPASARHWPPMQKANSRADLNSTSMALSSFLKYCFYITCFLALLCSIPGWRLIRSWLRPQMMVLLLIAVVGGFELYTILMIASSTDTMPTAPRTQSIAGNSNAEAPVDNQLVHTVRGEGSKTEANANVTDCPTSGSVRPGDFGAVGDGIHNDTNAVLQTIQAGIRCAIPIVIGPAGASFLVSPGHLVLQGQNLSVHFEATLLGPKISEWNPDYRPWPKGTCAYGERNCYTETLPEYTRSKWPILLISDSSGINLTGIGGGITAPGHSFWNVRNRRPEVEGYCLLKIRNSRQIRANGLKLQDSPMYSVVVMGSELVQIENFRITIRDSTIGDNGPHNTDGVSIIASKDVRIDNCHIESGDDNIVIKGGTTDVLGQNLVLIRGKGISIGSLGENRKHHETVSNVFIRNVTMDSCFYGARIKTWKGSNGVVRNVTFADFKLSPALISFVLDQDYCPRSQRPEGCNYASSTDAILIENVALRNFSGTYAQMACQISCNKCVNVTFSQMQLRPQGFATISRCPLVDEDYPRVLRDGVIRLNNQFIPQSD